VATNKQIAANRANAQKSTGPKTATGRLKSSRNAFRHGLSLPLSPGAETSAQERALVQVLVADPANYKQLLAATELAQAQVELLRIRGVRAELMAAFDLASDDRQTLRRLAALDHYERLAHSKRRRASLKLRQAPE
jgi:hypothetical protein